MDSLTQIVLGAAIGEATAGRQIGRRAALWGAICGTLPDLDSFVPYGDAVTSFTYHRSFSHSLIILALLTPLVVWLIQKIHPSISEHQRRLFLLVFLTFETHALLDSLTVYGTQLFWPLSDYPVSLSTIFIIDPAYTVLLSAGVLSALFISRTKAIGHKLNFTGIVLSSLYITWTVAAKIHVEDKVKQSLQDQNISYNKLLTTPTPFNTILWRAVVMDEEGYYDGFYSLLDKTEDIQFTPYPSHKALLDGIEDHWPVKRLQWFSHGFYSVTATGNDIFIADLRMGLEPDYVFRFKVAEASNPHPKPVQSIYMGSSWRTEHFRWVWNRLSQPKNN